MVRKITLAAIASALSRRSASSPLMPGMATSVTITSGRSRRAASINPAPSATVPTRENSLRRRLASPSVTIAWSSASSIVGWGIRGLGQRDHDLDPRAVLGLGVDREASPHQADSLVETDQAQTAPTPCLSEVEPAPVVTDDERQIGAITRDVQRHLAGLRVPGGVLQCFLGHAV